MKKPTIADIANNCGESHYFDRKIMKFFGQTRASFRVYVTSEPEVFQTWAPMRDKSTGRIMGHSVAYWTPKRNENGFVVQWVKTDCPEGDKE